jgi:hypothetical protein
MSAFRPRFRPVHTEIPQFPGPLAIAPVAHPDQPLTSGPVQGRAEERRIGSLVPGPGPPGPAAVQVTLADDLTESQHSVVLGEIVFFGLLGLHDHAVVGVVEEEEETARPGPVPPDSRDQLRLVPFVDKDDIGLIQHPVEIRRLR